MSRTETPEPAPHKKVIKLAYITTSSPEEAESLGTTLVEERLAACVNIIPGMRSLYHWQGTVEKDEETILIAKTTGQLFHALTERVKQLHSYDVPCVLSIPTGEEGNEAYRSWLFSEVDKP